MLMLMPTSSVVQMGCSNHLLSKEGSVMIVMIVVATIECFPNH